MEQEGRERFINFVDALNVDQRYKPFQAITGVYRDDLLDWNIPYRTEEITDFVTWGSENPKLYHITNGDKSVVISKSDAEKYYIYRYEIQLDQEARERFANFVDALNVDQRFKPFQAITGVYRDDLLDWNIPYRTEEITDFVAWSSENPKLYHITDGDKSVVITKSDAEKYYVH